MICLRKTRVYNPVVQKYLLYFYTSCGAALLGSPVHDFLALACFHVPAFMQFFYKTTCRHRFPAIQMQSMLMDLMKPY
jgi:hypothetical protein